MSRLRPGETCWRVEPAHRAAVLVDADAYFRAVRSCIARAERSIFILAWDIDSELSLPGHEQDGLPERLGDFLNAVVSRRKRLDAYVLDWDFAMIYALEREMLPAYKLGWRTHRRLRFRLDGTHPIGASHHQKVVVVDDSVAFVGGLDLTRCRWDTPEHEASSPRRCDGGKLYGPFHDVQIMVEGPLAKTLGDLARERWRRATGRRVRSVAHVPRTDLWPDFVEPDFTDVEVGIARTEPAYAERPAVLEVRALHLEAIVSAQRSLYVEAQYATAAVVADALVGSLSRPSGPEVVLLSRLNESGWLEEATMGVLRARFHGKVKEADAHGRYRMYYPTIPGLDGDCLNVHSKVLVGDDDLLLVGSANLSNRSMVLDTECTLAIDAGEDERVRAGIARVRDRLLAEHLGTDPAVVHARIRETGSLIGAIEKLHAPGERTLEPLEPTVSAESEAMVPLAALVDPEKPIEPERLIARFVPPVDRAPLVRRLWRLGLVGATIAALAAVWCLTPLGEVGNIGSVVALMRGLEATPLMPLLILLGYVVGGVIGLPITLLIAATGLVFGPAWGIFYATTGSLLSAAASYALGRMLGRDAVQKLAGPRVRNLARRVARPGILTVTVVRLLPIAPFGLVNLLAGALRIRPRDYWVGTALGMIPGIILTVTFAHQLAEVARAPRLPSIVLLVAMAAVVIAAAALVQRLLARRADRTAPLVPR